jgi:hypothetical protein
MVKSSVDAARQLSSPIYNGAMSDAVGSPPQDDVVVVPAPRAPAQRADVRTRHHRNDLWLAATALVAGLLALPLAQSSWHGPEVAAVLSVAATALFAGQRWAIAVIVIAELFLVPTVWPRAFLHGDLASRCIALVTLAAIVPGVLATRRAAAVLVVMTGWRQTKRMCRRVQAGLVAVCVLAAVLPLL